MTLLTEHTFFLCWLGVFTLGIAVFLFLLFFLLVFVSLCL